MFKLKNQYYLWTGITANGLKTNGEIEAMSINLAKLGLRRKGITPLFIKKKSYKLSYLLQRITQQDISIFFRQFVTLYSSGLPLGHVLESLYQAQAKPKFKTIIHFLKKEIATGKNLTSGFTNFPQYFDETTRHLIYIGEQSGTLDIILQKIAIYKEKSLKFKRKVIQALFYPFFVACTALIVSIIMLTLIVPRFADLFASLHSPLPAFTIHVIQMSNAVIQFWWCGIIPIFSILFATHFLKKSLQFKKYMNLTLLKIPYLGQLTSEIILSKLFSTLSTTLSASIPISDSLKLTIKSTGNHVFASAMIEIEKKILAGQQLHMALLSYPQLFPHLCIQMVKIGEETGTLNQMLEKLASIYENNLDHLLTRMGQLIEPLIMIILGVLIGGLIIAMYLPIFNLGTVM